MVKKYLNRFFMLKAVGFLVAAAMLAGTIVFALPTTPVQATTGVTYFLRADGNDGADGLTLETAWRTFRRAQDSLNPGDTLLVSSQDGDFGGTDRFQPRSGTPGSPVTVRAMHNERPVIRSKPTTGTGQVLFWIEGAHIVIDGLSFIDVGYTCRELQGANAPDTNRPMHVAHSHNITIINNIFDNQDNTDYGANPPRRSGSHLQVWGGSNITLRGNYFNGSGHALVRDDLSPTASGAVDMVQFQGVQYVLIEHNYFGNAGHAALAFDDWVSPGVHQGMTGGPVVMQHNVFSNAWGGGIYFGRSFGSTGPGAEQPVRMDGLRPGHLPGDFGHPGGFVIQNNIMFNYGAYCDYPKSGITPYANEGHIVRHNIVAFGDDYFGSQSSALGFTAFNGGFGATQSGRRHRFYNNVTFRNGGPAVYIAEGDRALARDVTYKNNIFFEDNSPNWQHNTMYGGGRPAIMLAAHNANIITQAERDAHVAAGGSPIPSGTNTFQQDFVNKFPGSHRFINNIIVGPDGRAAEVTLWAPGGFTRTLAQVQSQFPLRVTDVIGSPGMMGGFAGNFEADPMFVRIPNRAPRPNAPREEGGQAAGGTVREHRNMQAYDFRLQAGSPAINAGADLTTTTAAGINTTVIPVVDALYFTCGHGLIPGDPIIIGNNDIVRVVSVDRRGRTLTVNRPISFNNGDAVNLPFNGAGPDIGAFKFFEAPEILIDTVASRGNVTEILGIITSDVGQSVMITVRNGSGQLVYMNQVISSNSGSFQFLVPITGVGYTFTITGFDVETPVTDVLG